MKEAKKSSIRKTASIKRKSAVRRKPLSRGTAAASSPTKPAPAKKRFLTLSADLKDSRKKTRVQIPPILLEGDKPAAPGSPRVSAASPRSANTRAASQTSPLPDAYGTKRLQLTARDPNWIHAHWDFTPEQLRQTNARSPEGHMVLRLFNESTKGPLVSETRLHPESVRWLVHVPVPNAPYAAEIGFYNQRRVWSPLAAASPVRTPPAGPSNDRSFQLATLTPDGTMERHTTIKQFTRPHPSPDIGSSLRHHDVNSLGLVEVDSAGVTVDAGMAPSSAGVTSWGSAEFLSSFSNPMGGGATRPAFRLEVNAELIVYGATEPNATLQIGGQTIPLQPDGSFRFRFALPDGAYALPVKAVSAETGESRTTDLRFSRHTSTGGQVGTAPGEPGLQPPPTENL